MVTTWLDGRRDGVVVEDDAGGEGGGERKEDDNFGGSGRGLEGVREAGMFL